MNSLGSWVSFCQSRICRSQYSLLSSSSDLLALLVAPVGGDAVFGGAVHLTGADLHLEGLPRASHW